MFQPPSHLGDKRDVGKEKRKHTHTESETTLEKIRKSKRKKASLVSTQTRRSRKGRKKILTASPSRPGETLPYRCVGVCVCVRKENGLKIIAQSEEGRKRFSPAPRKSGSAAENARGCRGRAKTNPSTSGKATNVFYAPRNYI